MGNLVEDPHNAAGPRAGGLRARKHRQDGAGALARRQRVATTTTRASATRAAATRTRATTDETDPDLVETSRTTTARAVATTVIGGGVGASTALAAATQGITSAPVAVVVPLTTSSSTTTITPSDFPSGTAAAANGATKSTGLSRTTLIAVIVVCVVIGLLLIGFFVWRCLARKRANAAGAWGNTSREKTDNSLFGGGGGAHQLSEKNGQQTFRSSFGNHGPTPDGRGSGGVGLAGMFNGGGGGGNNRQRRSTNGSDERNLLGSNVSYGMHSGDYSAEQHSPENVQRQQQHSSFMAAPPPPPPLPPTGMSHASQQYNNNGGGAMGTAAMFGAGAGAPAAASSAPVMAAALAPALGSVAPQDGANVHVVKRTFEPSLADELVLYVGDRVTVDQTYDDGWCLGSNLSSVTPGSNQEPQRGVFPKDCVEEHPMTQPSDEQQQQASQGSGGGADLRRVPTLPPIDLGRTRDESESGGYFGQHFGSSGAPAIQVSGPDGHSTDDHIGASSNSLLSRFPEPAQRTNGNGGVSNVKRSSSLIAGDDRHAELFNALGAALDGKDGRQ